MNIGDQFQSKSRPNVVVTLHTVNVQPDGLVFKDNLDEGLYFINYDKFMNEYKPLVQKKIEPWTMELLNEFDPFKYTFCKMQNDKIYTRCKCVQYTEQAMLIGDLWYTYDQLATEECYVRVWGQGGWRRCRSEV